MTNRKKSIFSIVTTSHLANGLVAVNSLKKHYHNPNAYLLVIDKSEQNHFRSNSYDGVHILYFHDFLNDSSSSEIRNISKFFWDKYKQNPDALRWCLKSVMLIYFLTQKQYSESLYIDPDLYFISDLNEAFGDFDGILLTKHHRPLYPSND
jgi:hypothetical protein